MCSAGVECTTFEYEYATFKIIEYEYEYPKPEYEVLEYFLALFKIINIRLIFYECLKQFLGCHESMINEHFLQLIMQNKNKNFIARINKINSDTSNTCSLHFKNKIL